MLHPPPLTVPPPHSQVKQSQQQLLALFSFKKWRGSMQGLCCSTNLHSLKPKWTYSLVGPFGFRTGRQAGRGGHSLAFPPSLKQNLPSSEPALFSFKNWRVGRWQNSATGKPNRAGWLKAPFDFFFCKGWVEVIAVV